jgi:transposase
MIQKAYKFRIYPNNIQRVLLNKTFGCCRFAWNSWVENFNKKTDKVFKTPKIFKEEISVSGLPNRATNMDGIIATERVSIYL